MVSLFSFVWLLLEIEGDSFIKHHYKKLWENLVEQNLHKIVEPYSRVQISHIAKTIGLDQDVV